MPFIPVPNTVEVSLRMVQDSQNVLNVVNVEFPSAPTVSNMDAVGAAVVSWWSSHRALVSTSVSLREIGLRDLSTASGAGILYSTGLPSAGQLTGDPMSNNTTVAIKWGTGLTGRSYRGRLYHVGLAESQVTGNIVVGATISGLLNSYNALRVALNGTGGQHVIVSRYANKAPRITGVTTPVLTASFADVVVDSQRNRLPGRGR